MLTRTHLILALQLSACMPHFAPVDIGKPLSSADLALSFSKGKNGDADDFSEQLVLRALMEDDVSLYVKLTVTNLASSDGRADLTVVATLADGRKLRFKERADRGEWTFAKDRFYAVVGDGSIEVDVGRARVKAKNDELDIDLEVTSALPPLRPRGGLYDRGGRFYVTTIPIPRGAAHARLEVLGGGEAPDDEGETPEAPGEAPPPPEVAPAAPQVLELDGVGYAEHRAGNVAPYDLARRWYSIVDIGEDETVVLSVFERAAPSGKRRDPQAPPGPVQGFFFATNDEQLVLYEPEVDLWARGWHLDEKTSYPLPDILYVADPKHASFEGVIVAGALSERKDDLESLKKLERIVVRKFMKPWTFRFDRARFLFRRQNPGEAMREIRGSERLQVQQLN